MELKDLFDLHEKLETRINAYWTYWSVAVFAIGGWLFSGKHSLSVSQEIGIAVGVLVFFFCNLGVLWHATKLVTGVRDEIRLKSAGKHFESQSLTAALAADGSKSRLQITVVLHLVIDTVVVCLLFIS